MKCEYCSAEPTRSCLKCGCLFCRSHGEVREPDRQSGQPYLNSLCQKCVELTYGQFAKVGSIFIFAALMMILVGATVFAASGKAILGLILAGQAMLFGALGTMFRIRYGRAKSGR